MGVAVVAARVVVAAVEEAAAVAADVEVDVGVEAEATEVGTPPDRSGQR